MISEKTNLHPWYTYNNHLVYPYSSPLNGDITHQLQKPHNTNDKWYQLTDGLYCMDASDIIPSDCEFYG